LSLRGDGNVGASGLFVDRDGDAIERMGGGDERVRNAAKTKMRRDAPAMKMRMVNWPPMMTCCWVSNVTRRQSGWGDSHVAGQSFPVQYKVRDSCQ